MDSADILQSNFPDTLTERRALREMEELVGKVIHDTYVDLNVTKRSVDEWFLMESPWPGLALTATYLWFVLGFGPKMMSTKAPYQLKTPMLIYNAAMVAFSSWWVYEILSDSHFLSFFATSACKPTSTSISPNVISKADTMAWLYLMSKYVEFLDTIFFVLRRKQNQVTFLHVFHHTNMAVFTWIFVKYIIGSQILFLGLLNSFVHTVMYSYYLLSALGPKIQKYLWWKRYITTLQIGQFFFAIGYLVVLLSAGCQVQKPLLVFGVFNTFLFLFLFLDFYKKAYRKPKADVKKD